MSNPSATRCVPDAVATTGIPTVLNLKSHVHLLLIVRLPVDVDEGLAVHVVDVEDPIQVVRLVLEDASWPATGLPRDLFTLLI